MDKKSRQDGCMICGLAREDHEGYRTPIGAVDLPFDEQLEINRQWLKFREDNWPGGFAAFCQEFGLDEGDLRRECEG